MSQGPSEVIHQPTLNSFFMSLCITECNIQVKQWDLGLNSQPERLLVLQLWVSYIASLALHSSHLKNGGDDGTYVVEFNQN